MRVAPQGLQLALLLAHEAGLRHGTIARFSTNNCDFGRRLISGRTKNNAQYSLPMTQRLYERLLWACAGAQDATEPLVWQFHSGQRKAFHPHYMSMMLRKAQLTAGIAGRWTFHDIRRTAARALYERTHDLRKVQRLLCHASLQTTLWYLGNNAVEIAAEDLERPTATAEGDQKTA